MKIGKYDIKITKSNVRTFFVPYTFFITYDLFFSESKSNLEILKLALIMGMIPFVIEVVIENYYRNNLHKRKDNWFWSGYREESK